MEDEVFWRVFRNICMILPCDRLSLHPVGTRFIASPKRDGYQSPHSPNSKRLKRRNTTFSPVSAITLRTRSPTRVSSSFTHGCIINTCSPKAFLSLLLIASSRFSAGTRSIDESSMVCLRVLASRPRSEEHTSELQSQF